MDQNLNQFEDDLESSFYLNYGTSGINPTFNLESLNGLFQELLPKRNNLTEARHRTTFSPPTHEEYYSKVCDFCGMPLTNVHLELLPDGRIRCERCTRDQVETQEEFQTIYKICKKNFETLFKTELPRGIQVYLSSDRDWPTQYISLVSLQGSLKRRLGVVYRNKKHYEIYMENGISRLSCMFNLICSFTLIWQDYVLTLSAIEERTESLSPSHGADLRRAWQIGMALWAGVEYLWLKGEISFAQENDQLNQNEAVEIKQGYLYFKDRYPFQAERDHLGQHHPFHPKKTRRDLIKLNSFLFQELEWEEIMPTSSPKVKRWKKIQK